MLHPFDSMRERMGETVKKSNAIDAHVGGRVRARRKKRGMTQQVLAEALGITHQQIQKLEEGTNRIGAGRLQQIARILDVPVALFFKNAPQVGRARASASQKHAPMPTYVSKFVASDDGLALMKAFTRIPDAELRRIIVTLVERLAGGT
jgi:transcriptional regulator with XRE-family HTH domain